MKAVVTKINKNKAIILHSDGTFVCVPNKNYVVGQEIYIKDNRHQNFIKLAKITAAAAACLLLFCFGVVYTYNIPQSYVSIDINPSIELEVNMFNYVINSCGVNSDGIAVLEKVEIKNKSMEEAIELIIAQINKDGYVGAGSEKAVIVAVHCNNHEKEQRVMENAKSQVVKSFDSLEVSTTVSINSVNEQTIEQARNIGTTAGKLELIENYIEISGDDTDAESLVDTPIQEITENIDNIKKEKGNSENSQSNNSKDKDKSENKDKNDDKDNKKDKEIDNGSNNANKNNSNNSSNKKKDKSNNNIADNTKDIENNK